jgi:putative ABC transport system permease protein
METLLQDIRYGLRTLRKSTGFTAVAVITLALGIGATTSIFSVIEAVVLRPLPYRNSGQTVLLADAQHPEDGGFLYKDLEALKVENHTLEDVALYYRDSGFSRVTLFIAGEPELAQGAFASSNLFSLMGVPPILGRTFSAEEETRGEHVVVLSHALWISRFGALPDVIGKMLQIDGVSAQIIGVMPEQFQFPARDQLFWVPITTNRYWRDPALSSIDPGHSSGFYQRWQAVGRLKPGIQLAQAQAEVKTIFSRRRLAESNPNRGGDIDLLPVRVNLGGNTKLALVILFSAVSFVLLIACSNVANLLLARGTGREHEIAVRSALGASRRRIVGQLFAESALLAILAGCIGLMVVPLAVRSLISLAPADIPRLHDAGLDGTVLAFALGISLLAAVLAGLAPAWKLSHASASLGSGSRGLGGSVALRRTRSWLVIAEFATASLLLIGAGLLVRSFMAVEGVDPGFQASHILTMSINLPAATPERSDATYNSVIQRVGTLPDVQAVGAVDRLFDLGSIDNLGLRSVEGKTVEPKENWSPLRWASVRGDYFQAMGAALLRGRYFSTQDGADSPLVAIVDESMARRYWPNEDAIGRRFKGQDTRGHNDDWLTVVGIIRDMRRSGLERQPIPHVYEPYTQAIDGHRTGDLVVRVWGTPKQLSQLLRTTVRQVDHSAILTPVTTMEQQLSEQLSPRRFLTVLLGTFSAIALLLAAGGIYGVLHYSVAQQTREIGIRMALGARPRQVVMLIVRDGAKLSVVGLVIGVTGSAVMTRFLRSLLFGIGPMDPLTLAGVSILLGIVALLACYIPARRAAKVDPMVALRYE